LSIRRACSAGTSGSASSHSWSCSGSHSSRSTAASYALPLAGLGWLVAAYHNLVYAGIVPESLAPCAQGVSCREEYLELFGFLSIPMLALLAFTAIAGILVAFGRRNRS
jgi:disulfide bond formation protein DsbB